MDNASSISMGTRKSGKSRRVWSAREEEVLVDALKELVAKGWKSDNGFRVSYLNKLEDSLKDAFPSTDLKGQPHINSKITTWKKHYGSLSAMLRRTGVNFNRTTFMIDCPNDELWDAVVREDNNAAGMRFKSWPFYESWIDIFGNDRATGEGAEDVMDAVNELVLEDDRARLNILLEDDYVLNLEDFFEANQSDDGTSVNQSDKESGALKKKTGGRKRKSSTEVEKLYDIVGQLCLSTTERFQDIARFIGYEYGLGESRKRVFELLGSIPDLTLDEKLDVAEKLASSASVLEMFIGFPPDARARYVGRLLGYGRP